MELQPPEVESDDADSLASSTISVQMTKAAVLQRTLKWAGYRKVQKKGFLLGPLCILRDWGETNWHWDRANWSIALRRMFALWCFFVRHQFRVMIRENYF